MEEVMGEILALGLMMNVLIVIILLMSLYIGHGIDLGSNAWKLKLLIWAGIAASLFEIFWNRTNTVTSAYIVSYGMQLSTVIVIYFLNEYILTEVNVINSRKGVFIYTILVSPCVLLYIIDPLTHWLANITAEGKIEYGQYSSLAAIVVTALGTIVTIILIAAMLRSRSVDERAFKNARICAESIAIITIFSAANYIIIPEYYSAMLGLCLGIAYLFLRKTARIAAEREARAAAVQAELDAAKNIQKSLIPHEFPAFPGKAEFDLRAAVYPCTEVGGDFYDYYMPDEDHLVITMGDVSGHGMPAALFMALSKSIIKHSYSPDKSAGEILELANERICEDNKSSSFVTVWYAILDLASGKLDCATAGHEMPIIRRADGRFEIFDDKPHGALMGTIPGLKYKSYTVQLSSGEGIFVYTDGIPEARDKNDRMLYLEGLLCEMNKINEKSGEKIISAVHEAVEKFSNGAAQADDITMLYLEYK